MFTLDYDKMLLLDAEDLAEGGILRVYQSIREILSQYVAEPAQIQEVVGDDKPSYIVRCDEQEYVIYSTALPDEEGQSWEERPMRLSKLSMTSCRNPNAAYMR